MYVPTLQHYWRADGWWRCINDRAEKVRLHLCWRCQVVISLTGYCIWFVIWLAKRCLQLSWWCGGRKLYRKESSVMLKLDLRIFKYLLAILMEIMYTIFISVLFKQPSQKFIFNFTSYTASSSTNISSSKLHCICRVRIMTLVIPIPNCFKTINLSLRDLNPKCQVLFGSLINLFFFTNCLGVEENLCPMPKFSNTSDRY